MNKNSEFVIITTLNNVAAANSILPDQYNSISVPIAGPLIASGDSISEVVVPLTLNPE